MHGAGVLGAGRGDGGFGFERHAARRTGAGLGLAHFWAHRADVSHSGLDRWLWRRLDTHGVSMYRRFCGGHAQGHQAGGSRLVEIGRRIAFEVFQAASATEVIIFSGMFVDMLGGVRIDVHPTDGVAGRIGSWSRGHLVFEERACVVPFLSPFMSPLRRLDSPFDFAQGRLWRLPYNDRDRRLFSLRRWVPPAFWKEELPPRRARRYTKENQHQSSFVHLRVLSGLRFSQQRNSSRRR